MKLQPTINVLAEASTLDTSKWSKAKLLKEVLSIYNDAGDRRQMDEGDLHECYSEQAYEMRANDMRPPSFKKWLSNKVRSNHFSKSREAARNAQIIS